MRPFLLSGYDSFFMNLMLDGEGSLSASKALTVTLFSGFKSSTRPWKLISAILPFS